MSFARRRIPIRWRLAGTSALLTLVILCGFAVAVGVLTVQRIREDFDHRVAATADDLRDQVEVRVDESTGRLLLFRPRLDYYASSADDAVARLVTYDGQVLRKSRGAPDLGPPLAPSVEYDGWRIESRAVPETPFFVQYARPLAEVQHTIDRVRFLLILGVLGGAGLALLAGLMLARRAMAPISRLTETAREIERTRDPARRIEIPDTQDEVAELAATLDGMLRALTESRAEMEAVLARQRQFVADASHELRTPLTSVLANLELLAETLEGEQAEAARSALRSSRRMRRLVADLLLLARADAQRVTRREPLDVARVLVEAAGELEPVSDDHEISVDAAPAVVDGARDELHRLALNLMENAVRHTPPGTRVRAAVEQHGDEVRLVVEDDGPGVPEHLRDRVFERFVRGEGDRGGSFGLGLSIVRAVAESHGGRVELQSPSMDGAVPHGTRFVVTLPAAERSPVAV